LARLEGIVEGHDKVSKGTGLEFWFSLPEIPVAHPSPHKIVVVMIVVVFTMLLLVNTLLAPVIQHWPVAPRLFVGVMLQVPLMTYVVMPQVTRLLKSGLYRLSFFEGCSAPRNPATALVTHP
jgi:hypothetical protein